MYTSSEGSGATLAHFIKYSKSCLKRPLKNGHYKDLNDTFDLHLAIIGLKNQLLIFLRVAVLNMFVL